MRTDYENLEKSELLSILREIQNNESPDCIRYPPDVLPYVKDYRDKQQEHMIVLCLDGAHQVIDVVVSSIGILNKTIVHPREIFRSAITKNACSIILVHNHPSGNTVPSPEDLEVTKRIKDAGVIIGINLLDHVIVTPDHYYSFLEKNTMPS